MSVLDAGVYLGGISRRQVYRLLDDVDESGSRVIETVHIGSRRLVVRESLDAYVARLRADGPGPDPSPIPPPQPPNPGPRPPHRPGGPQRPPKSQ
ncbi:MAG: hypothetical protein ACRD0P_31300 [Stackebrandtia sp.]